MNEINLKTMRELSDLYEKDFALWLEQTVKLLQTQDYQNLDVAHLIEEIESLGKRGKRELKNRLTTLLEHALMRCFTDLRQDSRGWTDTIRCNQKAIKNLLQDMPSLKIYCEQIIGECYQDALQFSQDNPDYQNYSLPKNNPFPTSLKQLLNDSFWE